MVYFYIFKGEWKFVTKVSQFRPAECRHFPASEVKFHRVNFGLIFDLLIFELLKTCSDDYMTCLYECYAEPECMRSCANKDENCREGMIKLTLLQNFKLIHQTSRKNDFSYQNSFKLAPVI